jgi:CheY-like chemotaxis protein
LFTQAEQATGRTHGGLGIGLALARRLLEMHGGDIVARSDGPGRGSVFIMTMPVCDPPVAGSLSQVDDYCVPSRVVIIDDNQDAATAMSMLIEQLGGQTRTAHDARSGIKAVEEFEPDVVFLDIGMPGIDGYEACRRMRQFQAAKQFVIVALTGWGQSHDRQRAFDAGFDAHLTKPVDSVSLMRVLASRARDTRSPEGRDNSRG